MSTYSMSQAVGDIRQKVGRPRNLPAFSRLKRSGWEPTKLQDHHKEILRRLSLGQRAKEIAHILDVTEVTISIIRNSDIGQGYLNQLHGGMESGVQDVKTRLKDLAPKAVDIIEEALGGKVTRPQNGNITTSQMLKAAFEIVGIEGHVKPTRVDARHTYEHKLSSTQIEALKQRAIAEGVESGNLVTVPNKVENAEFEEIPKNEN